MKYPTSGLLVLLSLALAFIPCCKGKSAEGPNKVIKNLARPKVEEKGDKFVVTIDDLKVSMILDPVTKEIVETPTLKGIFRIDNISKDLLWIQSVTIEYMDRAGKPIAFQSGEKVANSSLMLSSLKPGDSSEAPLDVSFPRAAVKTLDKLRVNVDYVPYPLKRKTLILSEKMW